SIMRPAVLTRGPMKRTAWGAIALALGLASVSSHEARGEAAAISSELVRATKEVRSAKGPEVYAARSTPWRTSDRSDAAQVEESLASCAEDKATSAPAKVYTELLLAYARRRRGDLEGSTARVKKLGFVNRWMVVGPFENEGKAGFDQPYAPEQ